MTLRFAGLLAALLFAAPAWAANAPTVPAHVEDGVVVWTPSAPVTDVLLDITGPGEVTLRRAFSAGERIALDPAALDAPLADGLYLYGLYTTTTSVDGEPSRWSQTGGFEVRGGVPVQTPILAQVIADDLVIIGSTCTGFDCANGESFGFDTLRLKENNVRIHFDDTSASASFPGNDWEITINDTVNGGASYFGITDRTSGRRIVTFAAGAPVHSLVVANNGHLGLGTESPVVEMHSVNGDTPTLRLEQNGANGWTPQTWDVAGNETNFFVRDATNGSLLPFKILPNSPTDLLVLRPTAVTVGTKLAVGVPVASIDASAVLDVGGRANLRGQVRVAEDLQVLGRYIGSGTATLNGDFGTLGAPFRVRDNVTNTMLLSLAPTGNLTISGTLVQSSDVNVKENVVPVDPEAILSGVVGLPMTTWEYIADQDDSVHLGPMAQDFRAAFGLGMNDTTIASVDADGVALASVQALHARSEADRARIAELEARLARLEALLTETLTSDD